MGDKADNILSSRGKEEIWHYESQFDNHFEPQQNVI